MSPNSCSQTSSDVTSPITSFLQIFQIQKRQGRLVEAVVEDDGHVVLAGLHLLAQHRQLHVDRGEAEVARRLAHNLGDRAPVLRLAQQIRHVDACVDAAAVLAVVDGDSAVHPALDEFQRQLKAVPLK